MKSKYSYKNSFISKISVLKTLMDQKIWMFFLNPVIFSELQRLCIKNLKLAKTCYEVEEMTQKVETLSLHGLEVVENVVNRLISTFQIGF